MTDQFTQGHRLPPGRGDLPAAVDSVARATPGARGDAAGREVL